MRLRSQLPTSWLWRMAAARASRRHAMRAMRPGMVCAPWRSRESWPLRLSMIDSIHWRTAPSSPKRRGSSLRSGRSSRPAHLLDHGLELAAGKALISEDRAPRDGEAFKDFRGDLAFAEVGGGQLKADRHAVR